MRRFVKGTAVRLSFLKGLHEREFVCAQVLLADPQELVVTVKDDEMDEFLKAYSAQVQLDMDCMGVRVDFAPKDNVTHTRHQSVIAALGDDPVVDEFDERHEHQVSVRFPYQIAVLVIAT